MKSAKNDIPTAQILIVDDEDSHAEVMAEALKRLGHVCTVVHDLESACNELEHGRFDLIVTDLVMDHEDDGQKVLATARQTQENAQTIMVTAHGDVPTAKMAIRGGAYDFIEKPLDLDSFRTLCNNALREVMLRSQNSNLQERLEHEYGLDGIIGQSPAIRDLVIKIRQIGNSNIPVLITGESGTGKELIAQAIHQNSPRAKKTFKPVNCAGLSEGILESELFGHVRGAFTNAERDRQGVFEFADKGTLFLDEIGDMPAAMQAKLLRVLESGEVVRVGANEPRHVDVRLVSATNHDLAKTVEEKAFREDLYFRIRGVELHLPSLRERAEDIPLLVSHYVPKFAGQRGIDPPTVDSDTMSVLQSFNWPGNVRQLINTIQQMVVVCDGTRLEPRHLPMEMRPAVNAGASGGLGTSGSGALGTSGVGTSLDQMEKQAIREALRIHAGNREAAAKMLGIGERTLYRKLKEYGLK